MSTALNKVIGTYNKKHKTHTMYYHCMRSLRVAGDRKKINLEVANAE